MEEIVRQDIQNKTQLIFAINAETREKLAGAFQSMGCKVLLADSEERSFEVLESVPADLMLIEVKAPISLSFGFLKKLCHQYARSTPIFLLCDRVDPMFDEAYYEGIDAIFVSPIQFEELASGVASSYSAHLDHTGRNHRRKRTLRTKVNYSQGSWEAKGYVTNLSEGGMFVGSMDELPNPAHRVEFDLLVDAYGTRLTGYGSVKWVRPKIEFGKPRGFGLKFEPLDSDSQDALDILLNEA